MWLTDCTIICSHGSLEMRSGVRHTTRRTAENIEEDWRARRRARAFSLPVMCQCPASQKQDLSADVSRHPLQVEQLVSSTSQRQKLLESWQEWNCLRCGTWFSSILSKRMTDPQQTISFNGACEAIDAISKARGEGAKARLVCAGIW